MSAFSCTSLLVLPISQYTSLMFEDLPLLEIDRLKLVGTHVICRYLGRRAGLCGSTAADQALIEAFAEAVREAREPLLWYPFITDKEEHKQPRRCGEEHVGGEAALNPPTASATPSL